MPGEFLSDEEVFSGNGATDQPGGQFMSDEDVFGTAAAPSTPETDKAIEQSNSLFKFNTYGVPSFNRNPFTIGAFGQPAFSKPAVAALQQVNAALQTPSPPWIQPAEKVLREMPLGPRQINPRYWAGRGMEAVAPYTGPLRPAYEAGAGFLKGTAALEESLSTPANIGLAATTIAAPYLTGPRTVAAIHGLMTTAFAGMAIKGTPEQIKRFQEAPSITDKAEIATEMVGMWLPVALPALHAALRTRGITPKGGETGAKQPSDAQVQARTTAQRVEERPGGEVEGAGVSDIDVGKEEGAGARGEVSTPEAVTLREDIEDALASAERKAAAGDHRGAAEDIAYVQDFMPEDPFQVAEIERRFEAMPQEKAEPLPVEEVAPSTEPTGVSIPMMITKQMEADLREAGFNQEEINKLTPQQAHDILKMGKQPVEETAPVEEPTVPAEEPAAPVTPEAPKLTKNRQKIMDQLPEDGSWVKIGDVKAYAAYSNAKFLEDLGLTETRMVTLPDGRTIMEVRRAGVEPKAEEAPPAEPAPAAEPEPKAEAKPEVSVTETKQDLHKRNPVDEKGNKITAENATTDLNGQIMTYEGQSFIIDDVVDMPEGKAPKGTKQVIAHQPSEPPGAISKVVTLHPMDVLEKYYGLKPRHELPLPAGPGVKPGTDTKSLTAEDINSGVIGQTVTHGGAEYVVEGISPGIEDKSWELIMRRPSSPKGTIDVITPVFPKGRVFEGLSPFDLAEAEKARKEELAKEAARDRRQGPKRAEVPAGWEKVEGGGGLRPVRSLDDESHAFLQPVKETLAFRKIINGIRKHLGGRTDVREVAPGGKRGLPLHLLPEGLRTVEALARKIGLPYHWYESDNPRLSGNMAFYDKGHIFLNKNMGAKAPDVILAHEFVHYLEEHHPELYARLEKALDDAGYRSKGKMRYGEYLSAANYGSEAFRKELIADFMLETLDNPARMDRHLGKNVPMLERVVTAWRDFVERLGRAFGLRRDVIPTASGAVKRLHTARNAFDQVFADALNRERLPGEPGGPEFANLPRDPRAFITSGAEKVSRGLTEIGPWLRQMVKEHGPGILKENYRDIFEQSKQERFAGQAPGEAPDTPGGRAKLTSTKNAVVDRERVQRGLTPIAHGATMSSGEHMMEADAILANDPWAGRKLVDDLASGRKNTISGTEEAILLREKMESQVRMVDAARVHDSVGGPDRESAGRTFDEEAAYSNRIDKATSLTGSYWSELGLFRQRMWKDDYSGANLRRRLQRAKGDEPVTTGEVLEADRRANDLENKRQAMEKKRNDLVAEDVKQRQKRGLGVLEKMEAEARANLKSKGRLKSAQFAQAAGMAFKDESTIGAAHIARGLKDFDDFRSMMLSELGPGIDPHMQQIYRQAREIERNSRQRSPAERLEARKGIYRERIAEEKRKRAAGEVGRPARQEVPPDEELLKLITEYEKEKRNTNEWIYNKRLEQRSKTQKALDIVKEIWALPRGAKSSFDLSGIGRQGGLVLRAHPIRTARGFPEMLRAMKSRDAFDLEMQRMAQDPKFQVYDKVLEFSDISQDLTKNEEAYRSVWADKIPIIAHSQYAYVYHLNRIRFDTMKALEADLTKTGTATPEELAALGRFVNIMTGKGDIGGWHKLNTVFWAPQYAVSRFQFLLEPARLALGALGGGKYAEMPRVRKAMAKEYARVLGGYGVEYSLIAGAIAAGIIPASISLDPRSADFGKIKIGDTRIDPMAGLSQATVLVSRLVTGQMTAQSGEVRSLYKPTAGYGKKDWFTVVTDFLRGKLAPWPATIINYANGQDVTGQPKDIRNLPAVGYDLLGPLVGSDIYEAMKSNGIPAGLAFGLFGLFGWGLQTYSQRIPARQPSPRPRPHRPNIRAGGLPPGTPTIPRTTETPGMTYNVIR